MGPSIQDVQQRSSQLMTCLHIHVFTIFNLNGNIDSRLKVISFETCNNRGFGKLV